MPDRFNKSQTKEYLIFIDQGAGKESKSHLWLQTTSADFVYMITDVVNWSAYLVKWILRWFWLETVN